VPLIPPAAVVLADGSSRSSGRAHLTAAICKLPLGSCMGLELAMHSQDWHQLPGQRMHAQLELVTAAAAPSLGQQLAERLKRLAPLLLQFF
jgi:hypothetical protein